MQNAHLRLGLLEFVRFTEKTSTRIRVRVDRYIGEDGQAHLVSVFGNDSDIGAITAAVHEKASFSVSFPDGETKEVSLGEKAACYRGSMSLPGRKHPVRHLVAISQELHTNGSTGKTILLRYLREEAWAILVSFLGLPAIPEWATSLLGIVEAKGGSRRSTESDVSRWWYRLRRRISWIGLVKAYGLGPSRFPIARVRSCGRSAH